MAEFEVPDPILNSPYIEPQLYWKIEEGVPPEKLEGRRPAGYFYREPGSDYEDPKGNWRELEMVNLIRERLGQWRDDGYPGVSRTTLELLQYWRRDGRQFPLFFAQLEAAETIIFLREARQDLLQGVDIPADEPSASRQAEGYSAFLRFALKMATGAGKTMVMGMLTAWSILNKVNDRTNRTWSDVVLVVCPNITIRNRLRELQPSEGEASIYRKMDLVPSHLMSKLNQGRVIVTNWHVFEPQRPGGYKVVKTGKSVRKKEIIHIGKKTTYARGRRYLTVDAYRRQIAAGLLKVLEEKEAKDGSLERVFVEVERFEESDTSLVRRILGRDLSGKKNILIFNDEAHHAYRIPEIKKEESYVDIDEDWQDDFKREATVWIDGLDKINKKNGVNFCVDLSATPYYISSAKADTNKVYPWVVSDFGLADAIESGLVKIPQLAIRDSTGEERAEYRNIWRWIMEKKLTPAEKGAKGSPPKPAAILKWANTPIIMLAGLWQELFEAWREHREDPRPPVFIIVCKNIKIATVLYDWLANGKAPAGIAPANIPEFRNKGKVENTIRVDSKVAYEVEQSGRKGDENQWMRLVLDTVGKTEWPQDRQGRPIYPEGFKELAEKTGRDFHPPGRDVKCIISVSMLTEGWDCNTVTHIIGLRPFMSQLLCEQVVGRGLRRTNYDVNEDGLFQEEVAKIFGVPFEVVPFKETSGSKKPKEQRRRVHALPSRERLEIKFPRVEGYQQAIRNRVTLDWGSVAGVALDSMSVPTEVQLKAHLPTNEGRPSLYGPGRLDDVSLNKYRRERRVQELAFELAKDLTREYKAQPSCEVPTQVLFPQLLQIVNRYLKEKVNIAHTSELIDVFLSPYYGWVIERLVEAIKPDTSQGEAPEVPRYEAHRGDGSTSDVDFWTSKPVCEIMKSHVNYVVADTKRWEQSAAYFIDTHDAVEAFVKNDRLGFGVPYMHDNKLHDYIPDFIVKLNGDEEQYLIIETKGRKDDVVEVKSQAAKRWVAAVNADGKYGTWHYAIAWRPEEVVGCIDEVKK